MTSGNVALVKALRMGARKHVATKKFTQDIERQNLTLRSRLKRLARKAICFSKSEELHDKVIGEFISREHYQLLWGTTILETVPLV